MADPVAARGAGKWWIFPSGFEHQTYGDGSKHLKLYILPSGKHTKSNGKIHHFLAGKINYFNGHFQLRKLLVYWRVKLGELLSIPPQ